MGERRVYVVEGSQGDYEDRRDWPVAAYGDKRKAERHAKEATALASELREARGAAMEANDYRGVDESKFRNPLDPSADNDSEIRYYVLDAESSQAEQLAAKAEEIARLRAELGGILEQVRSMGCPPATDEACPMCVLERLVRAALAPEAAPEPCDCEPDTITCGRNDCRKREAAKGGESNE